MITAKRILVPHDFSKRSEAARQYALDLAEAFGARVDVLHVTDKTATELPFAPGFLVHPGSPHLEITRVARARDTDLIVMATHGRGLVARTVLGSVATKVTREAPCPVLTIRRAERPFRLANILVAIDFEATSNMALAYGRSLCRAFGARLHLLHVMDNYFLRPIASDPHMLRERAEAQLAELLTDDDRRTLHAQVELEVSDTPADAILEYAAREAIDLIVVATDGQRTMERLLVGSVAEQVVRHAVCPVLTVRRSERHVAGREIVAAKMRPVMAPRAVEPRHRSASA